MHFDASCAPVRCTFNGYAITALRLFQRLERPTMQDGMAATVTVGTSEFVLVMHRRDAEGNYERRRPLRHLDDWMY